MASPEVHRLQFQAPTGEFNLSRLERVIYGPGKIAALKDEMERRGLKRAVVVTTDVVAKLPILSEVTGALGSRCASVFMGIIQHVPRGTVNELQKEIERVDADCLVSLGGGSPIDSSKVAIYGLLDRRELVHIAVPTTLSAAEYTHAGGVTDESTRVKSGVYDMRVLPRTVINDPALTLSTPDWLWVSTGIRALDHAIECAYAIRHQPISDALAAKSIALFVEHLHASITTKGDEQLAHRGHCQFASWYSIYGAMNTRFGLSHLLGHQIGPRWNVPHGVTSCITLPNCHALHGGDCGRTVWSGGGRLRDPVRSFQSEAGGAEVRRPHRRIYRAIRCSEEAARRGRAARRDRRDCGAHHA